jgi:hypothetical protein
MHSIVVRKSFSSLRCYIKYEQYRNIRISLRYCCLHHHKEFVESETVVYYYYKQEVQNVLYTRFQVDDFMRPPRGLVSESAIPRKVSARRI